MEKNYLAIYVRKKIPFKIPDSINIQEQEKFPKSHQFLSKQLRVSKKVTQSMSIQFIGAFLKVDSPGNMIRGCTDFYNRLHPLVDIFTCFTVGHPHSLLSCTSSVQLVDYYANCTTQKI